MASDGIDPLATSAYLGAKIPQAQAADIFEEARTSGHTRDLVSRNLEKIRERGRLAKLKADSLRVDAPRAAVWMAEDPFNAAVVSDDLERVTAAERIVIDRDLAGLERRKIGDLTEAYREEARRRTVVPPTPEEGEARRQAMQEILADPDMGNRWAVASPDERESMLYQTSQAHRLRPFAAGRADLVDKRVAEVTKSMMAGLQREEELIQDYIKRKGEYVGFWESVGDATASGKNIPFVGGLFGLSHENDLVRAQEAKAKGQPLTGYQEDLLVRAARIEAAERLRPRGVLATVGEGLVGLAGYGVEFYLTAGVSSGVSGAIKGLRSLRAMGYALGSRWLPRRAAVALGRGVAAGVGGTVAALARTPLVGASRIVRDTVQAQRVAMGLTEDEAGQLGVILGPSESDGAVVDFLNSWNREFISTWTETVGGDALVALGSGLKALVFGRVVADNAMELAVAAGRRVPTQGMRFAATRHALTVLAEKAAWQGPIVEYGEEEMDKALQWLVGPDKEYIPTTWEEGLARAIIVSVPGGIAVAAKGLAQYRDFRTLRSKVAPRTTATENAATLQGLAETVDQGLLVANSPVAREELLRRVTDDEVQYLDLQQAEAYFEKVGLDAQEEILRLTGNPEAYEKAKATGTMLEVPVAGLIAKGRKDDRGFFERELRLTPEAKNLREVMEELGDEAVSEAELAELERTAPPELVQMAEKGGQQVTEEIMRLAQPAIAAGRVTQAAARQSATVTGAKFRRLGLAQKEDPMTLFKRFGEVRISTERVERPAAEGLQQGKAVQTDTPEFKAWFGDSKVVDEQGKPLVVYHGGTATTTIGPMGYATPSRDAAETYSRNDRGGRVTPLFMSIRNPATSKDIGNAAASLGLDISNVSMYATLSRESFAGAESIIAELKRQGFDGVHFAVGEDFSPDGDAIESWAAFSPTQIKSATGNRGTFDPNAPNILRQEEVPSPRSLMTVDNLKRVRPTDVQTNIRPAVSRLVKEFPQLRGAGLIPAPAKSDLADVASTADELLEVMRSDPEQFPIVKGSPLVKNMDYGATFTPTNNCPKGEELTKTIFTLRDFLDEALEGNPDKARIKTAAATKLHEASVKKGLETPCLGCYTFGARMVGANFKPISRGQFIYKPGEASRYADEWRDAGGLVRAYGTADFTAMDIPSWIYFLKDLQELGIGVGAYTKNLNLLEVFGDSGIKINISVGSHIKVGLPIDIASVYAKRYKNAALVAVGISRKDVEELGENKNVHLVIPFHRAGTLTKAYLSQISGLEVEDFTGVQNELLPELLSGGRPLKLTSKGADGVKGIEEARRIIKQSTWNRDPQEYLAAIEKASSIIGMPVTPKFPEWGKKKWYGKLIGSGPAEYGKNGDIPKIDLTKVNLARANNYMLTASEKLDQVDNKYASMARQIAQVAKKKGVEGIEALDVDTLYQSLVPEDEQKRGAKVLGEIQFPRPEDQTKVVNILVAPGANQSTLAHELSHLYFTVLEDLVVKGEATDETKANFAALAEFVGAKEGKQLTKPQREKLARAWEAYLLEGKAPSFRLAEAFRSFHQWLTRIYKSVLGIPEMQEGLTPEIREVFARMLATDEELAEVESAESAAPMFPDPASIGWTGESADKYLEAGKQAQAAAREKLVEANMRYIRARDTKAYRQREAKIRPEIIKEVWADPAYQARAVLERGVLPDGTPVPNAPKLSREVVAALPDGEKWLKALPPGVFAPEGQGISPDVAADLLGLPGEDGAAMSGIDLLTMLATTIDQESEIEARLDGTMRAVYGDPMANGTLHERALDATYNERRATLYRLGLEKLWADHPEVARELTRKVLLGRPMSKEQLDAITDQAVAGTKVRDLRPNRFRAEEVRQGRAAVQLYAAGKFSEAIQSKARQLMAHEMYRKSRDTMEQMDRDWRDMREMKLRRKGEAQDRDKLVMEWIRYVLGAWGVNTTHNAEQARQYLAMVKTYETDEHKATYAPIIAIVKDLLAGARDYREATVEEYQTMVDSVQALWKLSRSMRTMVVEGKRVATQGAIAELIDSLEQLKAKYPKALPAMLTSFSGMRRRVESWVDAMDGGDINGTWRRHVWAPISHAGERYRSQSIRYTKRISELVNKHGHTLTWEPIPAPMLGNGVSFPNKGELLGAMMHMGNWSNKQKYLRGEKWATFDKSGDVDTSAWDAQVKQWEADGVLTEADYDFVQAVWDVMTEIKPDVQKAHMELEGMAFPELKLLPFVAFGKTYAGGYMPAKVDYDKAPEYANRGESEILNSFENGVAWPSAGKGATMARNEGFAAPLRTDFGLVTAHVDWALRYAYIQPRVKDVSKILFDTEFKRAMGKVDPTIIQEVLIPWLKRSVNQAIDERATTKHGRVMAAALNTLRKRSGMVALTGNLTNALIQQTGYLPALSKVKAKYMGRAFVRKFREAVIRWNREPDTIAELAASKSQFMANMQADNVIEWRQQIREITLGQPAWVAAAKGETKTQGYFSRHMYFLQKITQGYVNDVVWFAAYEQALDQQMTEDQAVESADSSVRLTQGAFSPEDLSRVEAGGPMQRAILMFWNYWNTIGNLYQTEMVKVARQMGVRAGAGRMVYLTASIVIAPQMLAALAQKIAGGGWDDDDGDGYLDDVLAWGATETMGSVLAMAPGGTLASRFAFGQFTKGYFDDRFVVSPIVTMLESSVRAPFEVYDAIMDDTKPRPGRVIRDVATLLTIISGIPFSAVAKQVGYAADVETGYTRPEGPADVAVGVLTGKSKKAKKTGQAVRLP